MNSEFFGFGFNFVATDHMNCESRLEKKRRIVIQAKKDVGRATSG
jgi:hypothetical protein